MFNINEITNGICLGLDTGKTAKNNSKGIDSNSNTDSKASELSCSDYFSRDTNATTGTLSQCFHSTIAAIEEIQNQSSPDLDLVYSFSGFGAIREIFDESKKCHTSKRLQLTNLLTDKQLQLAKEATLTSFYTPASIPTAFWDGLCAAGFKGGRICDPAVGTGRLIAPIPTDIKNESDITLIEYDELTHSAAEILYPNSQVKNAEFQDIKLLDQDIVISNPPFNNAITADRSGLSITGFCLHEFFVLKSIKSLRNGGLFLAILPTSFLDTKKNDCRKKVSDLANLIGGVRVPYDLFQSESNTKTAVDILLFQASDSPTSTPKWLNTEECQLDTHIYYNNEAVLNGLVKDLSTPTVGYLFNRETVLYGAKQPDNLQSQVYDSVYKLARSVDYNDYDHQDNISTTDVVLKNPNTAKEFTYNVSNNNELVFQNDSSFVKVEVALSSKRYQRILGMIDIATILCELIELESCHNVDEHILQSLRLRLNTVYDHFIQSFGYVSNRANTLAFKLDSRLGILSALEENFQLGISKSRAKQLNCNPIPDTAEKAKIFSERAYKPWSLPTSASNPEDALALSLAYKGSIDFDLISNLLKCRAESAKKALVGKAVFWDPSTKDYVLKESYLSGDVKLKLNQALAAEASNPMMTSNILALKKVIPEDVNLSKIHAPMTAHWLEPELIQTFLSSLFGYKKTAIKARYNLGKWDVRLPIGQSINAQVDIEFSTNTHRLPQIIDKIYSHGQKVIYSKDSQGNITGVDHKATSSLSQTIKKIELRWLDFIALPENRITIERLYNDKVNRCAPYISSFDGHFYYPDISKDIKLYPHQNLAVRRALTTRDHGFLLDVQMGGGKTISFITYMHEAIRLGMKNRFACVVPNHLTVQTAGEWLRLYPNDRADLLILNPQSMSPQLRLDTLLRLKTGDYKYVIIPVSTFKKIPAPMEATQTVINNRLNELEAMLNQDVSRHTVRDIENQKRSLREQMNSLQRFKSGEDFHSLGFDGIVYDESQSAKNSGFATSYLRGVKGLGTAAPSQLSLDLNFKVQYLIDSYQFPGVLFASGTPISNSLLELYGCIRMLAPKLLSSQQIECLDDWAISYTKVTQDYEVCADNTIKLTSRIKSFNNVAELEKIYGTFAYTITDEDLKQLIPKIKDKQGNLHDAIVPMTGGKPIIHISKISDESLAYMQTLAERSKDFARSPVTNDNSLLVISDARKASISPKMVDAFSDENFSQKTKDMIVNIAKKYHADTTDNSVQLCFVDIGTPDINKEIEEQHIANLKVLANKGDADAVQELDEMRGVRLELYKYIKQALIDLGIKDQEIAFVQDYQKDSEKVELYQLANTGQKRVILSTMQKLSTGGNLQQRISAVHVLSPPLRPSDLDQAIARAIRPGSVLYKNAIEKGEHFSVDVILYALDKSCDAWLYNLLEAKSSMIRDFRRGSLNARSVSMDENIMTYAQIKAAVTGNKVLLNLLKTETKLLEESTKYNDYLDKLSYAERQIKINTRRIETLTQSRKNSNSDHEDLVQSISSNSLGLEIRGYVFTSIDQKVSNLVYSRFSSFRKKMKFSASEEHIVLATIGSFTVNAKGTAFGMSVYIQSTKTNAIYHLDKTFQTKAKLLPGLFMRLKAFRQDISNATEQIEYLNKEINELQPILKKGFCTRKLKYLEMEKIKLTQELAEAENEQSETQTAA